MLISHEHRFVFVHIYKNAGTSITEALLPFAVSKPKRIANKFLRKIRISRWDPREFRKHVSASELIADLGEDTFKSYFSFAIVRNPWDWQASLYAFVLRDKRHPQHDLVKRLGSFESYIEWRCANDVRFQRDFVFSKQGTKLVNFIGRYEQLYDDFDHICSQIGIHARLPKMNVSGTKRYQDYYNKKTIELVRKAFAPDIELFNYDFD